METEAYNNYCARLLRGFSDLYQSGLFSDVILSVDASLFPVHRAVLAAGSQYFHALFSSGLSETSKNVITVHEIAAPIMETVLKFLYSGSIELQADCIQELLSAADMLQIPELVFLCCKYLKSQLDTSNCLGILQFADLHSLVELRNAADSCARFRFVDVACQDEFLNLPVDFLIPLLRHDDLRINSEKEVLSATLMWLANQDEEHRVRHALTVLSCVRFSIICPDTIRRCAYACEDPKVRQCLTECAATCATLTCKPRRRSRRIIYLVGGYTRTEGGRWTDIDTLSVVDRFDSFSGEWTTTVPLSVQRSSCSAVQLGDTVYVIGGEDDSLMINSVEVLAVGQADDGCVTETRWISGPSLLSPRSELGACSVNGMIYVLGGWVDTGLGTTVEVFDPELGRWAVADEVRREDVRVAMGVVEHDGIIYVIGGTNEHGYQMNTTLAYNPVTQEWSHLACMKSCRACFSAAALNGRIYAVGGWNENEGVMSSMEEYDIQSNRWTVVAPMSNPRASAAVVTLGATLVVFGGRVGSSEYQAPPTLNTTETYDPATNVWTLNESMPTSRCAGAAVVL